MRVEGLVLDAVVLVMRRVELAEVWTEEASGRLSSLLKDHELVAGIGEEGKFCSVEAINVALSGERSDEVPVCMSEVVGGWMRSVQDGMSDEMRNCAEWKALLPLAAGTGRCNELRRGLVLEEWVWETILPKMSSFADELGFGSGWRSMTEQRLGYDVRVLRCAIEDVAGEEEVDERRDAIHDLGYICDELVRLGRGDVAEIGQLSANVANLCGGSLEYFRRVSSSCGSVDGIWEEFGIVGVLGNMLAVEGSDYD